MTRPPERETDSLLPLAAEGLNPELSTPKPEILNLKF